MRGLSLCTGFIEAAKADVASLTAFEIGLWCGCPVSGRYLPARGARQLLCADQIP
jgi:hypothetical protein